MIAHQRTILVVGPSWVGDMVMAQAFFMALRQQGDVGAVDVLAPPGAFPLLERMPEVRHRFCLSVRHRRLDLGPRLRLARQLRQRGYDQAYVIPSSVKAALVPALAGIPVRTGHRGEFRVGLINDVRPDTVHDSDRNVRGYLGLLMPRVAADPVIPRPCLRVDAGNQAVLVAKFGLTVDRPIMALAPGAAFGPAKRWPVEHYRELASTLAGRGWAVWILGGPRECSLGDRIADRGDGAVRNLCGLTSLVDAVDLLALAAVAVSGDSGLSHVAGAAGSAVVALFGPTSPAFAAPLTDRAQQVYLEMGCSPCFARTCPLGHHRCMRDIRVEEVLHRVDGLVDGPPPT